MSGVVDVRNGHIVFVKVGTGPETILCLHGNSSSASAFHPIAEHLSAGRTIYMIDLPGHGRSSGHEQFQQFFSFQGLRTVIVEFLAATKIRPTCVIGHSMGGHVAVQAISEIPSLRELVLISSPPIAGVEGIKRFFRPTAPTASIFQRKMRPNEALELARAFSSERLDSERLAFLQNDILRTDGAFREELGKSLSGGEVVDELELLRRHGHLDLLLIGGKSDQFINDDYYLWAAEKLQLTPDQVLLLPDVGHYPHVEAAEATAARIIEFLGGSQQEHSALARSV